MSCVTVIGGANVDIHGKSAGVLRANDSNPGSVRISAGGVGRNVAENLARLGVRCRLISAVGDDDYGRLLLRLTEAAGVDVDSVHVIGTAPTSTYLSVIDGSGEMKVAISDMSITEHLTPERLQSREALLREASVIVVDANLPADTLAWITSEFADKPIFADSVSTAKAPRVGRSLSSIHTLKTSAAEAEALTGLDARTIPELERVAAQLRGAGVERVFITRGRDGVYYSAGDGQGAVTSGLPVVAVRNTSGAGDAFLAGLVFAWLDNKPLQDSLHFATAAATVTLADGATNSPALTLDAINELLEARDVG